jgi:hypothetical protein
VTQALFSYKAYFYSAHSPTALKKKEGAERNGHFEKSCWTKISVKSTGTLLNSLRGTFRVIIILFPSSEEKIAICEVGEDAKFRLVYSLNTIISVNGKPFSPFY